MCTVQLIKTDQCQCTGPFGWTDHLKPPCTCSLRKQVPDIPNQTSPNPKDRKKIARHAHLTPHSSSRKGAQSFPYPRRWMPRVVVVCVRRGGEGGEEACVVVVMVVVVVRTLCYTRESVLPRARMHLIGWQNTWEQAPGVPATPSPP